MSNFLFEGKNFVKTIRVLHLYSELYILARGEGMIGFSNNHCCQYSFDKMKK